MAKGKSDQKDMMKEGVLKKEERTEERAKLCMQKNQITRIPPVGTEDSTATLESGSAVFYKTQLTITIGPSNCALGLYLREMKPEVHTETCTRVFIAALHLMTQNWKQPRHPSTSERINPGTPIPWTSPQQ